jgi:hypothetical protein
MNCTPAAMASAMDRPETAASLLLLSKSMNVFDMGGLRVSLDGLSVNVFSIAGASPFFALPAAIVSTWRKSLR